MEQVVVVCVEKAGMEVSVISIHYFCELKNKVY